VYVIRVGLCPSLVKLLKMITAFCGFPSLVMYLTVWQLLFPKQRDWSHAFFWSWASFWLAVLVLPQLLLHNCQKLKFIGYIMIIVFNTWEPLRSNA
jgi:hypothetical protein